MRIHRSAQTRAFTVLPNGLLQDRRLSFTARGLLADLLSRPDGRREDGRQMADSSPQGRGAVRRALNELKNAGYYRVDTVRMPDGTLRSEAHVFDTPQPAPAAHPPDFGAGGTGRPVTPPVKDPGKETTLPDEPGGPDGPDEQTRSAVAVLFRVIRPEPRLRLGDAEARTLAPLVTRWLQRGCGEDELAHALLPGLPRAMHSPAAILRDRLQRKLPPEPAAAQPPPAPYTECGRCHDPVPRPGICRACAGLGSRIVPVGTGATATSGGVARARAALRARLGPPSVALDR
ncbi:hypothetical protein [Streptomyces sp. CBMA156]|uniref:hypothetical protein n=1 Tax=Streptomyces sp. CBMA156 TaxID=1930280 RepID=UPI001661D3A0|nr:hypothetical protein [Streptomyces sp. CBMA156]MBD0670439.1 hypothetical protein [Streptomyces sp. CBMA156]